MDLDTKAQLNTAATEEHFVLEAIIVAAQDRLPTTAAVLLSYPSKPGFQRVPYLRDLRVTNLSRMPYMNACIVVQFAQVLLHTGCSCSQTLSNKVGK